MRAIRFLCVAIVTLGLILLSVEKNFAADAKYPTRPIQVISGFTPGGTDVILRPFIDKMPDYLGQPMTFVYKTGASGAVGASFVTASKPDGYTLFGTSQGSPVITPLTQKGTGFTLESFTPICSLAESYSVLWVKSDARWKNLPEMVAEAKKNPGKISFTSPGAVSFQYFLAAALTKKAGITLNHIPTQGGASGITALLGGHLDMTAGDIVSGLPHVKAGTLRPLGIFSPKRIRALPNYPTVVEQGYPVDTPFIYGLLGPKDMPKDVVAALSSAARKVYDNHKSSLIDSYDKLGSEILYLPPEEYGANLYKQRDFFTKIIEDLTK
jgi:tripartite-type tricarboxylate transporter receptor subunit TctC